ncbi:P-loop containing nucleoside triphosphate hydrolase protein [Apiospora marii]|uniref:P-loop containing nucleoside triphosphate hydrolase protein n=1 Tax=Apiospora marii TaxID=335849 RepID=UPI0031307401
MSDTAIGSTASLTSDDSRKIFDLIDSLSSHGISNYLDLPQIIVCGDQSSGKSSVLAAISQLPFAVQDGLCTHCPTEIVLRRQEKSEFKRSLINPDKGYDYGGDQKSDDDDDEDDSDDSDSSDDSDEDKSVPEMPDVLELETSMEDLKGIAMGLSDTTHFSKAIIRVEIAGPDQPHLTLVDLPGLFEAATNTQSVEDSQMVKNMVVSYMKKQRSIILAVVSAANEFPLQQVTQRAREIDPTGKRTLGLITKPDKLDRNSNNEKFYLNLAKNKEVPLALGWHVLRNRNFLEQQADSANRDRLESEFFTKAPWNALPASQLGVDALKSRLSHVLHDHILEHIPTVLKDIQSGISECEMGLKELGHPRESQKEQRAYLIDISQRFTNLLRDAVRGDYSNRFFTAVELECHNDRRLRAVVRKNLLGFSKNMHDNGCAQKIVTGFTWSIPNSISRRAYIENVQAMLEDYRGCELPGTFNPMVVGELFKRQITPWQGITSQVIEKIVNNVSHAAAAMVKHVAPEDVAKHIQNPTDMAHQLLAPPEDFHPMTQNHYLTENVQKAKKERQESSIRDSVTKFLGQNRITTQGNFNGSFQVDQLIQCIAENAELTEPNMDKYAASLATDMVEAYYKVALKKFIDDFEVNAVEVCLMQKLPDLFSPLVVAGLSDETINEIAGENEDKTQQRQKLQEKLAALQKGEKLMLQFSSGTK